MKRQPRKKSGKRSFVNYMENVEAAMRSSGRISTADHYRSTLRMLRRYLASRGVRDLPFRKVDAAFMEAFEGWLLSRGLLRNSTSFYFRILRAVWRRAVEESLTKDRNPFSRVYTGVDKTRKRALSLPTLQRLRALDLSSQPRLEYARDIFLLSFYLRGMSFIDMAYLRKSDLHDGCVSYRRRKTGGRLMIRWTDEMTQTVERHRDPSDPYLLPILRQGDCDKIRSYRNAANRLNDALKDIAAMLGLSQNLTLYAARHSWASAAHQQGIPISVISEGMGHDSEATTRIYLASLDNAEIDRANDLVIASLK